MSKVLKTKKLRNRSRFFVNMLKLAGLCSTAFVIEACYGTPQADYDDLPDRNVNLDFTITDKTSTSSKTMLKLINKATGDTTIAVDKGDGLFSFGKVKTSRNAYNLLIITQRGDAVTEKSEELKLSGKEILSGQASINIEI